MIKVKRVISLLLSLVMIFGCMCVTSFAEGEAVLKGDFDGDGKYTTTDAHNILRMAAGIIPENVELCDITGDGYVTAKDAIQVLYEATNIGGVVIPDKNGENKLDDRNTNQFIVLISETYNVDPDSLVAIYSEPDSGTNYVLQFGNTGTIFNKKYEKSADNLVRVYHIGLAPARTISYTDGKLTGGTHYNCTASEGWMVFRLIKSDVMPQYPSYFKL